MKVEIFDIVNIIIMFQLVIFSIFLFLKKRSLPNILLGVQLFSQAAGIFAGYCFTQFEFFYSNFPFLFFAGYPFVFLWGPTFYLYVKSAAYIDFKLKPDHLIHFVPFLLILIYLIFTFYFHGIETKKEILVKQSNILMTKGLYFDIFVRLQVLFYIITSLFVLASVKKKLKENYSSVSKSNLSWINFLVTGFSGSFAITIPLIIYIYIYRVYDPLFSLIIIVPYFIFFNIIFFKGWYHPELFSGIEENVKYKSSKLTRQEAENWMKRLNDYMKEKKPYLNPELTLNQLSEELNISPRILSQVINEYFNQNFHDYINKLRIEESKVMLLDAANKKTVLEILYYVGFNTKSAYNVAFKKATGVTPTEFRKQASNSLE